MFLISTAQGANTYYSESSSDLINVTQGGQDTLYLEVLGDQWIMINDREWESWGRVSLTIVGAGLDGFDDLGNVEIYYTDHVDDGAYLRVLEDQDFLHFVNSDKEHLAPFQSSFVAFWLIGFCSLALKRRSSHDLVA